MNYNKLVVNLLSATLILSAVVGCKKGPQRPTPIPGIGNNVSEEKTAGPLMPNGGMLPGGNGVNPGNPGNPGGVTGEGIPMNQKPMNEWDSDNGEIFKAQTVYFKFDQSSIQSSEKPKIEEVARRMKSEFGGKGLRVQGHADERGTEEYNRSLGERRALAVREALVQLGVAPNMVETVSYGEDKPAVPGHTEAAWSKNRRAMFEVLTPPTSAASK